jgi:hypothetical protein
MWVSTPQRGIRSSSEGQRPGKANRTNIDHRVFVSDRPNGPTVRLKENGWPVGPEIAGAISPIQGVALRWTNGWSFGPSSNQETTAAQPFFIGWAAAFG